MKSVIKAVALDLDGTLLDTAPDLAIAASAMLVDCGYPPVSEVTVRGYIGRGADKLVKGLLTGDPEGEPDAVLFEAAKERFFAHYDACLDVKTRYFPLVLEGIAALKQAELRLACVTNKPARFTMPLLKAKNLLQAFDLVLSGDSLKEKKPHPMPLQHTCAFFGIAPTELLMLGDSASDVAAARAAGCPVFVVPYGYTCGVEPAELGADRVVTSVLDAHAQLNNLH